MAKQKADIERSTVELPIAPFNLGLLLRASFYSCGPTPASIRIYYCTREDLLPVRHQSSLHCSKLHHNAISKGIGREEAEKTSIVSQVKMDGRYDRIREEIVER